MLLFQQIEDLAYKHTDARRTIGEFLLAKKSRVREYNMQQIAEETFSSKSSLVRFAKALGFSGWKEFMEQFLSDSYYEESHYTDIDPNFPFKPGDNTEKIMVQLSNLAVESILDTTDQLDLKELDKAVEILYHSRQIVLMSQAPNLYVGELFRRKMATIGKNVLIAESDLGLLAHSLHKEDAVSSGQKVHRLDQPRSHPAVFALLRNGVQGVQGRGQILAYLQRDQSAADGHVWQHQRRRHPAGR